MSQTRQIRPKPLEISKEDLAKATRAKKRAETSSVKVNPEWFTIAEFGYYFGWEAIKAIKNNDIEMDEVRTLIAGARKVWAGRAYDIAHASFLGASSAQSKKPAQSFKKGIQGFEKAMRLDI